MKEELILLMLFLHFELFFSKFQDQIKKSVFQEKIIYFSSILTSQCIFIALRIITSILSFIHFYVIQFEIKNI